MFFYRIHWHWFTLWTTGKSWSGCSNYWTNYYRMHDASCQGFDGKGKA